MTQQAPDDQAMAERIRLYIETQLPDASDLRLEAMERIAVGWSHETWLFDAHWTEGGVSKTQGLCLRAIPVMRCCDTSPISGCSFRFCGVWSHAPPHSQTVLVRERYQHSR